MFESVEEVQQRFRDARYIASRRIATVVFLAARMGRPVLVGLGLLTLPLGNGFSRRIERQADDFALATTGNPAAFIGAMERLGDLNLAERRPNRLKEILLASHPALDRRIARARGEPA